MKHLFTLLLAILFTLPSQAQERWKRTRKDSEPIVKTRFLLMDIGINGVSEKDFETGAQANNPEGFDFNLAKSYNFTLSPIGQRVNLYNSRIFLEYQTMFEFFSYRFREDNTIQEIDNMVFFPEINDVKKSKLNIRYFTIPVGLTYKSSAKSRGAIKITAGAFAGYLLGSNGKIKYRDRRGKIKDYDDFNLNNWRYGFYGELGIGMLNIYYRQAVSEMFQSGNGPFANMFSVGFIVHGI